MALRRSTIPLRRIRDRSALRENGGQNSPRAPKLQFLWTETISNEQWRIYRRAIDAVRSVNIRFLLGGGFSLAAFTGRWRDTKDIDFYIHPSDRPVAIKALGEAGFKDYYERLAYDRNWIYRSFRSDTIVDIIWSMANQRAQVDEQWFERAGRLVVRDQELRVVPPEEFMWCKLYILQRDHCDWTDLFNLLYAAGSRIDWAHLIERLGEDTPLLKAMLTVYGWLCPRHALKLPAKLWDGLGMRRPGPLRARPKYNRIRLLDSRGWFAALQPANKKLEI